MFLFANVFFTVARSLTIIICVKFGFQLLHLPLVSQEGSVFLQCSHSILSLLLHLLLDQWVLLIISDSCGARDHQHSISVNLPVYFEQFWWETWVKQISLSLKEILKTQLLFVPGCKNLKSEKKFLFLMWFLREINLIHIMRNDENK